jgi:hypothetical protein
MVNKDFEIMKVDKLIKDKKTMKEMKKAVLKNMELLKDYHMQLVYESDQSPYVQWPDYVSLG